MRASASSLGSSHGTAAAASSLTKASSELKIAGGATSRTTPNQIANGHGDANQNHSKKNQKTQNNWVGGGGGGRRGLGGSTDPIITGGL